MTDGMLNNNNLYIILLSLLVAKLRIAVVMPINYREPRK